MSAFSVGFSSRYFLAAAAIAIFSASPSLAQVTFAQYNQTNVALQQWSINETTVAGITTTSIDASGPVRFQFSGVAGLPFTGPEAATFTLHATSTQSGQCNTNTCANGNSFDQAGYSGTFSFIDAGSVPGANLLSGTFAISGVPSQTGGSFGAQIGANVGTFGASTDATNPAQVIFTSAYLSFLNVTSETASWSLSSLKDVLASNGFGTTATNNSQAYPNPGFTAAGDGTFSTAPTAPLAAGSLQIVKNTVGGDGAFAFVSNFGLTSLTTSGGTAGQLFGGLAVGSSYSVSETAAAGWVQTGAVCTNGIPAAITIVAGATTTCTFTNSKIIAPLPGAIQVVKNTVGGDGTFAFVSNFGLAGLTTSGGIASQVFAGLTAGGSYSLSETVPAGWTQTSAFCTGGTPLAITVVAGATTLCTIVNTKVAPLPGAIQVVKNTVGGDGTFTFVSNFGLATLTTSNGTASQVFAGLTAGGSYSLTETVPAGWTQTSAVCTGGNPLSITVTAGVTTVCTIVNTKPAPLPGSIQVVKNTVGGDGTFAFVSNFGLATLTTSNGTVSQTFPGLAAGGTFSLTETVPAGWTQTSAVCTNGTPAAITVVTGVTTICTIVNTHASQNGSIRVVKNTVGGNGTFAFTSNFGLASLITVGNTASQTFAGLTAGGNYSLSETAQAGWTQTSVSCTGGTPAAIVVVAGGTTVCTVVNTLAAPLPGSIQIVKNTVGGDGTFGFTSNFGLASLTTIGGSAGQTINGLTAGAAYSVVETAQSGWTQTSASCTNGTLAAIAVVSGSTTVCTIVNTKNTVSTGSILVIKHSQGGNGIFAFSSNFGLTSLTTSGPVSPGTGSQTFSGLTPNSSYNLSETVPAGWTQTGASCTSGTPAAITVIAGATTICTITNTQIVPPTGSIQIVKNTVGGNGTFAFTTNFGLSSLTTIGGTASQTFSGLTVGGAYSLIETIPAGWLQTSAVCTSGTPTAINVTAGTTTVCTIINTQQAAAQSPDLTISKTHTGSFSQGQSGATYSLTVTNAGPVPTIGLVQVTDTLPPGLTATAISGGGWNCIIATAVCTRSDALAPGASFPPITVTVNVAANGSAFTQPGAPTFVTGDVLVSLADGTVQWRHNDWTLVETLPTLTNGQAKGMAFDNSGNLYVTHWYGTDSAGGFSGNNVARFDTNGNYVGLFGSGFNCNPSSIIFDHSFNAWVGQADCGGQILEFSAAGAPVASYSPVLENRGTYDIVLDNNQCTMYYTSEGPDVKRYDVCANLQLSNFNGAPLPDPVAGAIALLPGGGMLIANFSVISRLDAFGNLNRTYDAPGSDCWLGISPDPDGSTFWASDWCTSSVTHFDLATGNILASHVVSGTGFMVKRILVRGNTFGISTTNIATVAGGGEVNTLNDSASDVTSINPPPQPAVTTFVNAASAAHGMAAGSISSVFGVNIATSEASAVSLPLPTVLAGSSVQAGAFSAPLFFASPAQINLQIPWELAGQTLAPMTITAGSTVVNQQTVDLVPFAPGIFTVNGTGIGQAVAVLANTSILAAPATAAGSQPATAGAYISIYCTGLGAVSNTPATGAPAQSSTLSVTNSPVTVTIGGVVAQASFAGLAPELVGVYQVNVKVPSGVAPADAVPMTLSIGGVTSNTVSIAIQ